LLDVTRLVSRAGRVLTGIDRVERAWLARFLQEKGPVFGLVRTGIGYLLLDRRGLGRLAEALDGQDWGPVGLLARLTSRRDDAVRAAETMLRGVAIGRCTRGRLGGMLARHLPPGTVACLVGHADLTDRTMAGLRAVPGIRIVVMIHDTIPLDWPDFQREGTVAAFAEKFRVAARHADTILCPSRAAAGDIARHLSGSRDVPLVVTPLGVELCAPDEGALPRDVPLDAPYFVVLGTIEPRKNHAVLLDAWERLGPDAPWLIICGTRGWRNEAVFARLDRRPERVREVAGLSDGAVAALLLRAHGLLFPSLAEGFGLPAVEAAARGVPVICSDLPVFREVMGDHATFLDPRDPGAWAGAVSRHVAEPPARRPIDAPNWHDHFKTALGMT
jgi:glycosyltransferase involved in cell wall biosynthesis